MKYFFDTYALVEIVRENKNYKKYFDEQIITSSLNLGELYYFLLREFNEKTANFWLDKLKTCFLNADIDVIIKAMAFKFKNKNKKFSFIDCIGYLLAKEHGLIFLTGDKEFENLLNVEFTK